MGDHVDPATSVVGDRTGVRRATEADLRLLCTTAMRAFHDDPVMRWLYPADEEYFQPHGEVFRGAVVNWLAHQEPWCTPDVVGLAVWFPPIEPGTPDPPGVEIDPPTAPPSAELLRRYEVLGSVMAAHKPVEPHWYLQLLGTHPDWQRLGVGARLMEVAFERADREGLSCYLETETVANVAYYRRHGFEVTAEWDVDPDGQTGCVGPHMWGMQRPPR